jgi:glyoxylase-like metal-dependent hydrolase (beta-lactamase superfamily II)
MIEGALLPDQKNPIEKYPGIFQVKIPLPNNPLGFVNVYLLKSEQGSLLIDTGWKSDGAFDALTQQLAAAGVGLDDLRYIVVTHMHPDHSGLVGRLKELCQAELILHSHEIMMMDRRNIDFKEVMVQMENWLKINGAPKETPNPMQGLSIPSGSFGALAQPDTIVNGGEHLQLGERDLELIWTPGHSPGHLCVYDRTHKVLFSGDHVLPGTTPNISFHFYTNNNPLVDYLNALDRVAELEVDLVLPSHGQAFHGLATRVAEIKQHHQIRLDTFQAALGDEQRTAYQIAGAIEWTPANISLDHLDPLQKLFAVTETIAHLEWLVSNGELMKILQDGLIWYCVSC